MPSGARTVCAALVGMLAIGTLAPGVIYITGRSKSAGMHLSSLGERGDGEADMEIIQRNPATLESRRPPTDQGQTPARAWLENPAMDSPADNRDEVTVCKASASCPPRGWACEWPLPDPDLACCGRDESGKPMLHIALGHAGQGKDGYGVCKQSAVGCCSITRQGTAAVETATGRWETAPHEAVGRCNSAGDFLCKDGLSCIRIAQVCDLKADCRDGSDESRDRGCMSQAPSSSTVGASAALGGAAQGDVTKLMEVWGDADVSAIPRTSVERLPRRPVSTGQPYLLVVSIGVKPGNFARRAALRRTWLRWLADEPMGVAHVFFTEKPVKGSRGYTEGIDEKLDAEQEEFGDMYFQEGPAGYAKKVAEFTLVLSDERVEDTVTILTNFQFYLRVDDDGFLCARELLAELKAVHKPPFLQGRYHCHDAKARMDENYLLMSHDLAHVVTHGFATGALPFAPKLTFALSLGFLVPVLQGAMGLHVFDDGERFVWPYPGERVKAAARELWYGTHKRFKGKTVPFCENYIWSHWVKEPSDIENIFELQPKTSVHNTTVGKDLAAKNVCGKYRGFENGVPFYINPTAVVGPGWGIPGMRPLGEDKELLREITRNASKLYSDYRSSSKGDFDYAYDDSPAFHTAV